MFILGTQTDHQHPSSSNSPGGGQLSPANQGHGHHRRGGPRSRHHQNQQQANNQNSNVRLFVTMKPRGMSKIISHITANIPYD